MSVEISSARLSASVRSASRVAGVAVLVGARAGDVATTVPILAARPSAELNPIARSLGPDGYLVANLLAVLAWITLIEGTILLDRYRNSRRSWRRECCVRALAYGWIAVVSLLVVLHNATQIQGVL
jgi:hypothetical protein